MIKNDIEINESYPETKTNVAKYVYHLTYKNKRESILKHGLYNVKNKNEGPVFAHNTDKFETCWYWFCLDIYEFDLSGYWDEYINHILDDRSYIRFCVNMFYDIWRIDTEKVNEDWYIDYIGLYDQQEGIKENYYVKCYKKIDVNALTLCSIDIDTCCDVDSTNGIKLSYFNPIITRNDFIKKHNIEPEEEVLKVVNNYKFIDLTTDNKSDAFYWKNLGKCKFSFTEYVKEFELKKVA